MRLQAFKVRNIFQHAEFETSLEGNLIGIIGPNGSGKSNLLKAIQYTLTGEVPDKRKEQLLRWGATGGGEGVLELIHEGVEGRIKRSVSGGATKFKYGDSVDLSGITSVNKGVAEHLGLDRDIARTVFVPQAELDAILFDQPSKRELAFQRMCGIGGAAKLHKALGTIIADKFQPQANFDEQIALGKAEMDQMEQKVASLESQESAIAAELGKVDDEQLRQQRIRNQTVEQASKAASSAAQQIEQLRNALTADEAELKKAEAGTRGIELDKIDERIQSSQNTLQAAKEYQTRLTAWHEKQAALQAVGSKPVDESELQQLHDDLETMRNTVTAIQGNLTMYDKLLQVMDNATDATSATCPLCGSAITDFEQLRERLKTSVATYREELQKYNVPELEQRYHTKRMQLNSWDTKTSMLTEQEHKAKQLLDATETVDADVNALQGEINAMQNVKRDIEQMLHKKIEIKTRIDLNTTQLDQRNKELEKALSTLSELGVSDKSYAQMQQDAAQAMTALEAQLQTIQQKRQQQSGIKGQISELKARMQTLRGSLDALIHRREQQGTYNTVRMTLESVRSWFNYANGPHTLSVAIMNELTDNVNTFLNKLNAPFSAVAVDTDLSYRCPFNDGRAMPPEGAPDAADLSGGQKILLAIAFRMASYCMFANKQGLLSLDEPTTYLDDANVANFCNLLEKVKEVAKALNLQIFLSTHERAVIPFLDSLIDLGD